MRQNFRFDRTSSIFGKTAIRCTSGSTLIISYLRALPPWTSRSSSSLFAPLYPRTTTSIQRTIHRPKNSERYPHLLHNQKDIFRKLHQSNLHTSALHRSIILGPCSGLLFFSAALLVYSLVFHDNFLDEERQSINCLAADKPATENLLCENSSMTDEDLSGRPESLTSEQEEKLKELWTLTFQVAGILDDTGVLVDKKPKIDSANSKKPKKKRLTLFRKNKEEENETESASGTNEPDDKFGQTKLFNDAMANMTPESLKTSFWSMVKHDNPDALLLRFMRARRWDIEKALIMMISTMRWRLTEVHVDDDVIKNGELQALIQSNSSDPAEQKIGKDFLDQMRLGKSFLHGVDKKGRPLCLVRVRQHRIGEQGEGSLERYTVFLIETARMLLAPPVDTASVIFDMTGFSMANMDYTPVKFMIQCFEANYPECLGVILVHKAPWIFQGIWKIIRGWLDPVVASKVQFTNTVEEMEEYVERSKIIKEFGGDEDWEYKYVEPVLEENDIMKDTETRDKLLQERQEIIKNYEEATKDWIQGNNSDSSTILKKRLEIANSLKDNYWKLDPYLRARTYYDRIGVIKPGGVIQHYPQKT